MQLTTTQKKLLQTLALVLLLLVTILPASRQLLFDNTLFVSADGTAAEYVDQGLVRAASAFAMARTFNGVVSVFRESELQLEPGGVGVSLALGAALDPVNDLVERFSWVMLASLTSLGIQKSLIEIAPFLSIRIILTLALILLPVALWLPGRLQHRCRNLANMLLIAAVVLRFAIPLTAALNERIYLSFLQERHDLSMEALGKTVAELEAQRLDAPPGNETPNDEASSEDDTKQNLWNRTKTLVNQTMHQGSQMLDVKTRIETVKQASLSLIDRLVDLIAVFVLSTILLPLLFLWGLLRLMRILANLTSTR